MSVPTWKSLGLIVDGPGVAPGQKDTSDRFVPGPPILINAMKILVLVLALSVAGFATRQRAPISADEVTLRHRIYGDGQVTIFLLDIPPGQATLLHRHDRDMLSVFVNGGRTRASFNGAAPVEDSFTPGDVRFRSAGFTHSTENIGAVRFLSVIFEFVDSQGPRASADSARHAYLQSG